MVFWSLYNDLCIGDEYWAYYTRSDLSKIIRQHNPSEQLNNLSAILLTLAEREYIEIRISQNRSYGTGIQAYEIKIHPHAWDKDAPVKPVFHSRTEIQRRVYNEKRKAKRSAKFLV